jgi:hypothetical protein
MSEDRLERALQEMKQEAVDEPTLEAARTRTWDKVQDAVGQTCAEFRPDFRAYLAGELAGSRSVLMEDHLSRCPSCRASLGSMQGERRVVEMPTRPRASRVTRWVGLAAAAVFILGVAYVGRDTLDAMMAPGGPRATVLSASGGLYRLPEGALAAGAAIGEKEPVRTGPGAHAVLRLADGSMVDVNERTELFVTAAWSGQAIHLQRGDVIVRAAKQRRGYLRVMTRDSIASVKGTVFAVSAGLGGSVVSVVEGSVAVTQPGRDVLLSPGEQAASNPALASTVAEAVSWSPEAEHYLELLASFARIERQLAEHLPHVLRTTSALLPYLPAGAAVYGALPNIGGTVGQAVALAEQQAAENATFGAWWNSETGRLLRQIVERVQSVSALLGDEIVFSASAGLSQPVPVVMARVQPGKRPELVSALNGLFAETGEAVLAYSVSDDLMVVSNTPSNLAWATSHLGQGSGSAFAAAIRERYQRGTGWLVAIDAAPLLATASHDDAPPVEFAGMLGMKYVFVEQRAPAGAEENELTLAFSSPRAGMASWLADSGSGGAAEYLPADALVAGYVSTREPWQLFAEFTRVLSKENASFDDELAAANGKLGAGFLDNLTRAMGTEGAFALNGFSVAGPAWVMASLVNDPTVIDSSLQKLVEVFNAELGTDQAHRVVLTQESANGRTWTTLKPASFPFGITWTYDGGYMVAGSDRAAAERAIATRNGGSQLIWSPAFLAQLPASAGMHPSAFGWLNTKGALGIFSALSPSPALTKLLAERDPMLVVADAGAEQIHVASRSRLTGLIMDLALLQGAAVTRQPAPSKIVGQ